MNLRRRTMLWWAVIDLSEATVTVPGSYTYSGTAKTPIVTVTLRGRTIPTTGYTVSYSNNTNAGTATVTVTGIGDYKGTTSGSFTINKKSLSVTAKALTITYGNSISTGTSYVTTSGLVSGDSLTSISLSQSTTNATTSGTITPSNAATSYGISNYSVLYYTGNLTINKASGSLAFATTSLGVSYNPYDTSANLRVSVSSSGWDKTTVKTVSGYNVFRSYSNKGTHSSVSVMKLTFVNNTGAAVTTTVKVGPTCESSYDYTYIALWNASTITSNTAPSSPLYNGSGKTAEWTDVSITIPTGTNTLLVVYRKDTSVSNNPDCGYFALPYNVSISSMAANSFSTKNTNGSISYSSNKTSVVSVSSSGTLTINGTGTATITARAASTTNYTSCSASYTITVSAYKVDPTITAPTAKSGLTYNGTSLTLYNAGSNTTSGSFSYSNGAMTNAGSQSVSWTFTPSNTTYYNTKSGSINGTIGQREVTLSWGTTSWTYDKSAHSTTCTAGNLISGDSCTVTLTGNSITNAGTTTVTASSLSNSNYKLPSANTKTLTVNTREVTLTWGTVTWTYDKASHSTTCTAGNLCSGDTCTVTLTGNSITNKGTTTVTASSLSNSNYKLPSAKTTTLTINAKSVTLTWGTLTWTYDGSAHSTTCSIASGVISGDTCTVSLSNNSITNKGTTTVTATLSNSNYTPSNGSKTLTINARAVAYKATNESYTYDRQEHVAADTATLTSGSLVSGHRAEFICLSSSGFINVGSTTKSLSVDGVKIYNSNNVNVTSNYSITTSSGTITINPKSIPLTWGTTSWVYDASSHSTTCSIASGIISGDSCTVTLSNNSVGPSKNTTGVTVTASLSNSNYTPSNSTATIKVTARPINITAGSTSRAYNGSALTYNSATAESTGTNRGLVSGHSMTSCTVTGTITNAGSVNNVPSAAVIKSGSTNVTSNYSITYVNGTLTVSKATPTTNLVVQQTTYPTTAYVYFYSNVAGKVYESSNGTQLTASNYSSASGLNVNVTAGNGSSTNPCTVDYSGACDTWTIYTYFVPTDTTNYNSVASGPKTLSMDKATPTITLSATNRAYNGNALYATVTVTVPIGDPHGTIYYGTSSGATTYSVSCESTDPINLSSVSITNVGSATVYAYFVPRSPYSGYYKNSNNQSRTFTISKASGLITCPTAKTLTYNGLEQALVNAGSSTTGTVYYKLGTNGSYSTSIPVASAPGTYTVYAYASSTTNYNLSSTCTVSNCKINKYTPTVTVNAPTKSYDGYASYASATVSKPTGGRTPAGTIYYGTSSGATTYSVSYTGNSVNLSSITRTNAGSTTVYAYFVPDTSCNTVYNDSGNASGTITISKVNRTLTWTRNPSTVNDGSTITVLATPSAGIGDGTITYSSSNTNRATVSGSTVTGQLVGTCTITATISEGTNYSSATASYTLTITNTHNGHAFVNLGLPSGKKWANVNLGSGTTDGLYYQWGDTSGYDASQIGTGSGQKLFGCSDYKYSSNNNCSSMTKYNATDGKTTLDMSDDAARQAWGGSWRIPTKDEFEELINYTTLSVEGSSLVLTSTVNGRKLIMPRLGEVDYGDLMFGTKTGYYWTSSVASGSNAWAFMCSSSVKRTDTWSRYTGLTIRPIFTG